MGYEDVILLGTLYLLLKFICRGVFCAGYLRAEVSWGHVEQHIFSSRGLLLQGLHVLQFQRKIYFSDPLKKKKKKKRQTKTTKTRQKNPQKSLQASSSPSVSHNLKKHFKIKTMSYHFF